jgi:preprotein translocase subunit SecG
MIANILMILLLFQTFKMIGSVVEVPTTLEDLTLSDGTKNGLKIFSNALFVIQILLLVLLSYIGFKTGVNYKQSAKKQ